MPTKIYDLPAEAALSGTDVFPIAIDAASTTRKATINQVIAGGGGFGVVPLPYNDGTYISLLNPICGSTTAVTRGTTADVNYLIPFFVSGTITITNLYVHIGTGEAATTAEIGIYAADGANRAPSTLLGTTGAFATTSNGRLGGAVGGGPLVLEPGMYWVAYVTTGNSFTLQTGAYNSTNNNMLYWGALNSTANRAILITSAFFPVLANPFTGAAGYDGGAMLRFGWN